MTRAEILARYRVEDGIITSPGKFEGEPIWAPYFYHEYLQGRYEDADMNEAGDRLYWDVLAEDVDEFPELNRVARVSIHEDDMGFVYARIEGEPCRPWMDKQCDACGKMKAVLHKCWAYGIETHACTECSS